MKQTLLASAAAAILTLAATCPVPLSAQEAQTYHIKVGDFTELCVMDGINVVYTNRASSDDLCLVSFDALPSQTSLVTVESKKDKLTLRLTDAGLLSDSIPTLHVSSSMLMKVQNNGDSTVTVTNRPHVPKFSARLEGNGTLVADSIDATEVNVKKFTGKGTLTVQGRCETASVGNTGAGVVNCAMLRAADAKANVMGTGTIYVYASKSLSVSGMTGTIYYTGSPEDIKSRAFNIKLHPLDRKGAD